MLRLPLAAALLALAACGGERPEAVDGWSVIDACDGGAIWAHDSADDHAEVAVSAADAPDGSGCLVVRAHRGTRGKAVIRRELELDADGLSALAVDVRLLAGPPPRVALALRGADGAWFESPGMDLPAGPWRELRWDPRAAPGWAAAARRIDRAMVLITPGEGDCSVAVDALRGAGTWRWRSDPARLLAVDAPPREAGRHQAVELAFTVAWPPPERSAKPEKPTPGDRLLRRMVAGGAWITAPDGERWFQPAACLGVEDGVHRYAVRLAPDRAGSWRLEPGLEAGAGRWEWGETATVAVAPAAVHPGPLRLSADRRWFERGDGTFTWPLGMNVAWAADRERWLDLLARDGCTALRVWLAPWHLPLDVDGDLQAINQESAAAIDALLDGAAQRGLAVQLCLAYHGWFGDDWARNPFNAANGGPVAEARDFWSDGAARAGFRRLLDYAAARWGHHPGLLAWELVNEVDLAPRHRDRDVIEWHREMAAHLARIDRRRHPITTSVSGPGRLAELWRIGDIDLVNIHRYEPDPLRAIQAVAREVAAAGKPGWAAEAGRDWRPAQALAERDGVYLRQALWWSWVQGLPASSWAWWWDLQVQDQGLTRHHAALARFLAGEDPRGLALTPVLGTGEGLAVGALIGADRAWAYAADPAAAAPAAGTPAPLARSPRLSGLAPGLWRIERWDTVAGSIAERSETRVGEDGVLVLAMPAGCAEAAWKIVRAARLAPGATP